MKNKLCPICEEFLISSVGLGCKMCGMPLEDKTKDFCSQKCKIEYNILHRSPIKLSLGANQ